MMGRIRSFHLNLIVVCTIITIVQGSQWNPVNTTMIVMGRSGAGISSTVQQILGPGAEITSLNTSTTSTKVTEYEVALEFGRFFKIVDVNGLVDGTTPSEDAATISTLKSYCESQFYFPNFFLVVMRIDDSRFHDTKSIFTKTLDRISIFKSNQYGSQSNISNNVILFTRLLGETPLVQRRPGEKIEQFKSTIREFTAFPSDVDALVGDNTASKNNLPMQNGFYKLPNNQFYPRNILDAFLEISRKLNDSVGYSSIREFTQLRSSQDRYTVNKRVFNQVGNNEEMISQITASDTGITNSEISLRLQTAFNQLHDADKMLARSDLVELQTYFQLANIGRISQLPVTRLEKVTFFQNLGLQGSQSYNLLNSAFGLKMSDFVQNLVVGHGYDVTKDEILDLSPLSKKVMGESMIGYLLPEFAICTFLPKQESKNYSSLLNTLTDYAPLRLSLLEMEETGGKLNVSNFQGSLLSGFSIPPEPNEHVAQLSVAQEIRNIKCELNNHVELTPEFRQRINSLQNFNEASLESVNEWNAFFNKFGTHVVSQVYGGGYFTGIITGAGVKSIITDDITQVSHIFKAMLSFSSIPVRDIEGKPFYSFFGGARTSDLTNLPDTENIVQRTQLFSNWTESAKVDPVMLPYQLKLESVGKFAKIVNNQIGLEIERVLKIFVEETLQYKHVKKNSTTRNKIVITRPSQSGSGPVPTTTATLPPTSEFHQTHATPTNSSFHYTNPTTRPKTFSYNNYNPIVPPTIISTSNQTPYIFSQPATTIIPTHPPYQQQPPYNHFPTRASPTQVRPTNCKISPNLIEDEPETATDFRLTVVGQGYHVFKDLILSTSPLRPHSVLKTINGLHLHGIVEFEKYERPCEIIFIKKYNTFKEYALDKIKLGIAETNMYHIPSHVPKSYPRKIQPGNIVLSTGNMTDLEYFPIFSETRTGVLTISVPMTELLKNGSSFLVDLSLLPRLGSVSQITCSEKQKWTRFFDNHGTHIILSAYTGMSTENRKFDVDYASEMANLSPGYNSKCIKIKKKGAVGHVLRSRFSMKFEKLSRLITNPAEKIKYDWAYQLLLEGKLEC